MYLLPFFRHPDYALHSGTKPILAIYSAHHFESQPLGQRRAGCNATVHGSQGELQLRGCTRAPFGCAAAQLYLQWYPHLATFLVPEQAHAYHTAQGSKLGYCWPRSDPCADADQHQHGRLARMLSLWQAMARQHGFAGLHVLGTLNHDNNAAGVARAAGGPDAVGGLLQFFPTALLSTRPGHWSHAKGFMKCAQPTHPNNCTCFLNQLGEEGVETLFKASITAVSPSLGFARGAMPGWSSFPRGRLKSGWALCSQRSAEAYGELVRRQLHRAVNDGGGFKALHARTKQKQATSFAWHHLMVVNAWNEWGEQAVVEPTVQDGDAMLAAHRLAVQQVEQQVNHRHSHDHSLLRHSTSLSATPSESPRRPAGLGAGQDRAQSLARRHRSTRDGQDTTTHLLNTSSYKQAIRALIEEYQCHSAYIDVGSNIGVQIRKLYEPSLYVGVDPRMERFAKTVGLGEEPTAEERQAGIVKGLAFWNSTSQVLPIFDEYFGRVPRCGVCAIGVEPNPRHSPRHAQVQAALRTAGFGALWLSATAADVVDGTTIMKLSPKSSWWGMAVNDVGASVKPASIAAKLNPKNDMDTVSVATVDLAELVKFVHGNLLRLPDGRRQEPQIVMKVDTEGAEYRLLPHLIANDALCLVNLIFLEWHPQPYPLGTAAQRTVKQLTERALKAPQCKTVLSTIDDETFLYDGKPLHETRMSICPQRSDDGAAAAACGGREGSRRVEKGLWGRGRVPRTEPSIRKGTPLSVTERERLPCGCITPNHCLPANATLVFMGDSITRYQYLDLVYTLHFGNRKHERRDMKNNPLNEYMWDSWQEFYNDTTTELQPNEGCDCYRKEGPWNPSSTRVCENRIFQLPCGVRVAYVQEFGDMPVVGHWPPSMSGSMWDWHPLPFGPDSWDLGMGTMWRLAWPAALRKIVGPLLTPSVLVLNAGFHTTAKVDFRAVREAAHAAASKCVVWKTTTPLRKGTFSTRDSAARRAFANDVIFEAGDLAYQRCHQLPVSQAVLSSSGEPGACYLQRKDDDVHFLPSAGVYHFLNVKLLDTISERHCI